MRFVYYCIIVKWNEVTNLKGFSEEFCYFEQNTVSNGQLQNFVKNLNVAIIAGFKHVADTIR